MNVHKCESLLRRDMKRWKRNTYYPIRRRFGFSGNPNINVLPTLILNLVSIALPYTNRFKTHHTSITTHVTNRGIAFDVTRRKRHFRAPY